jgi:methylmalonyl-CoA mutase N-terminal domain/subunit
LPEEAQEEQKRRVKEYKNKRGKGFLEALRTLKEKAKGSENLMPYIFECAKEEATLGEISDTLREVWGTYDELKT